MTSALANQRVLITGGTGFIGSHLTRRLVREGARVSILTRHASGTSRIDDLLDKVEIHEVDIRNFGAVNAAIEKLRPRVVFHLAAAGVTEPFLSSNLALRVNVDGTINVIRASATAGAERIIHTGTAYEYGDQAESKQLDPISPYAAAKASAWAFSQMYYRTMGWPIVCLRLFQVYGPGQAGTLIPSAIQAALKGHPFPTTAGEQTRDWVYVDDVVDAYLKAAQAEGIKGQTFDIGTGVGTSVREVVEFVFDQFPGASPMIGGIDYRPGEVWSLVADTDKARDQLGWQASVELKDGLRRTVNELGTASPLSDSLAVTPDNHRNGSKAQQERDRLRVEILDKVSEYYALAHERQDWEPGQGRVQYAGRVFDDQEMLHMTDSVLEFWLTAGRYAEAFESKLGNYLGVREVIPVNSGSSANLVALTTLCSRQLRSRPLKPGDEVITAAVAFPTTLAPMVQNRLVPVLVDSEMGHYNIDVNQLEAALSSHTRAIMVTHTLGNPVAMDVVMDFAREHELYVIEDNCDALGSVYDGRMTGTFGHLGTSSFYPAHHITLGEGGAVYTNSPKLGRIARTIRDWGRDCYCGYINPPNGRCGKRFEWKVDGIEGHYDHRYLFTEIGYNLKITDPQAAVGLAQLDKLADFVTARKRNFRILYNGLQPLEEHLILPTWSEKADPSWFAFPLTIRPDSPIERDSLQRFLEDRQIETRLLFAGNILKQPGYRHIQHRMIGDLPVADLVMGNTFFIGVYPGLKQAQIEYMIEAFYDFMKINKLLVA
jgi:CDP-6-deoxy-D-xylo-4-hexulose-3-dehydrase